MDFKNNLNKLKQDTKKGDDIQHVNKNSLIIPFVHRGTRPNYENGFYNIIGHLSRYLLGYEWDINSLKQLVPNLLNNVQGEDSQKNIFKLLLNEFLFNKNNEIIISHPHLFLFAPPSYIKKEGETNTNYNNNTNGEREVALFFKDVLFHDSEEIYSFFSDKNSDNYIFKFILENMELNKFEYNSVNTYHPILDNIISLFNKDFNFLLDYPSFLLENIDYLFAYYYFFYATQLILKLNKNFDFHKDDDHSVEELFYLLEGETAQDIRKAVHVGYNLPSNYVDKLLCKIYVIDQINILLGTNDYMWGDIIDSFENMNDLDQKNFFDVVCEWVQYYRVTRGMNNINIPSEPNTENLKCLIDTLYNSLTDEKGAPSGTWEYRYPLNLLELGKNFHFIKFRTIYKYTFNLTNDMLLLLTAVCVKKRNDMQISELFLEFEYRGVFLDEQSQEEVQNFLSKCNLIDEKSDSEEAKYVKPIL